MPVQLDPTQIVETVEVVKPAETYPLAWVGTIIIRWGRGESGTAVAEMHPLSADGTKCLYRGPNGEDTVIRVEINSMVEAMGKCPELAAAMGPLIAAIHAWNAISVKEKEDAAKLAAENQV